MSLESGKTIGQDEVDLLADSWPRPLIALDLAASLAAWWCESRSAAAARGEARFARHAASPELLGVLFEARRARRLSRGLEEASRALSAQQQGIEHAPATQVEEGRRRISRLFVLSNDGSTRFYREVEKLCKRYASRLEAIVLECDEVELGEAAFGPGRTARAVLLDHKEAVVDFLGTLEAEVSGSELDVPIADGVDVDAGDSR